MTRVLPLLLACLSVLAAGCATTDTTPSPADGTAGGGATVTPDAKTVTVGDVDPTSVPPPVPPKLYTLSPATLQLKVNVPVNLTLKNAGRGAHDLVIDKLGVKINNTAAGASASITFTPTTAGTYDMYCTLGMPPTDHRSNGMAGKVVVS